MNLRLLRMGLKTLLGIQKQGFFIPYRYADSLPPSRTRMIYPALFKLMQGCEDSFEHFLSDIQAQKENFEKFGKTPAPTPRWQQDWFPRLDGAAAYTLVRTKKPAHIIEIGSGHSTRFMVQAIKDGDLATKFTAIDPAPRADISKLPVTIHNDIVQNVDPALFGQLAAGDILFIDSSHIAMPGTDVDYLFLNILPLLPAGIYVHIHDIFLPHDYPQNWEWRGYNEQQIVAPLLSGGYKILFSSQYISRHMTSQIKLAGLDHIPLQPGAYETSLWLEKTS